MKNVIEIKDLSFRYDKNKNVLREVNLSIENRIDKQWCSYNACNDT